MKTILFVLIAAFVSPQSQAFFPELHCYSKGSETPLVMNYVGDGMITVAHGNKSCELDVNLNGDASPEWIRFDNNNGNIEDKLFNTRCKPVLFSMFPGKSDILTDIHRLDLSVNATENLPSDGELPAFAARLFYFVYVNDGPGPLVFEELTCKVRN